MDIITTMAELDAKLVECDAACKVSDDALRRVFTTFRMDFSTQVPPDPFSVEYHAFQMAVYRHIAGREYSARNEASPFDVDALEARPFPFYTGSCRTVGYFTMGMGFLLHSLDLPAGARVVEFGPGWGNSTIAMAMAGLDVTAVDIEANFCDLLRRRARRSGVDLTVVNDDFMWAETVSEPFDAAIFFECFHHCADHMRLLRALRSAVKPEGRIYFCAEPILPEFPLPWGLRMDGESLWAIRNNGWMELGYRDDYFLEALSRTGWTATRHALPGLEWAAVWEARRTDLASMAPKAAEGAVERMAGSEPDAAHQDAQDQFVGAEAALRSAQNQPAADAAMLQAGQNQPAAPDKPLKPKLSPAEASLRAELDALYRSTSWRVTAPLRALRRRLRG